jgi:hypothetical protein
VATPEQISDGIDRIEDSVTLEESAEVLFDAMFRNEAEEMNLPEEDVLTLKQQVSFLMINGAYAVLCQWRKGRSMTEIAHEITELTNTLSIDMESEPRRDH